MLDTQVSHEDVQLQKVASRTHGKERLNSKSAVITNKRMRVVIYFCILDMRVCSIFSDGMYHTTAGKLLDFVRRISTKDCRWRKETFIVITPFAQLHVFDLKTLLKLLVLTKCNDDDDDNNDNNNNNNVLLHIHCILQRIL